MNALLNFDIAVDAVETESDGGRWVASLTANMPSALMLRDASFSMKYDIPDSFWLGLRECEEGRVVDLDKALDDPFEMP